MTKEEGDEVYNAYFTAFPGLRTYFDKEKKKSLLSGYILISPVTNRKSYIYGFEKFQRLTRTVDSDFWARYKQEKLMQSQEYEEMRKTVSEFFFYKGNIERKSLNYPIQGQSAECTKISCIYIFDYIIENNLFNIVKFVNTVHDENVLECPIIMADKIAKMVENCMCKAGDIYCKRVPLKASPEISPFWKK